MERNALINSRFEDLIKLIDARAKIELFVLEPGDNEKHIGAFPIYEILANVNGIRTKYKNYEVCGLVCGLITNVLIREA